MRTSGENIGFAVQRGNQPVDTFAFEDSPEFGATGRHLADRAVKVDWVNDDQPYLLEIGNPPLVSLPYSVP